MTEQNYLTDASLSSLLASTVCLGLMKTKYTTVDDKAKNSTTTTTVSNDTRLGFFLGCVSDWSWNGESPEIIIVGIYWQMFTFLV